jgi:hypothetical protein
LPRFDAELEQSSYVKEVFEGLSKNSQLNYKASLRQLLRFVNSKDNLSREISIDELVNEAKADVSKIEELLDLFYDWLQNKEIKGYRQREKKMKESSANQRVYGYLRGFFVNLDIPFERRWIRRIPKVEKPKQAIKKDHLYTFYDVDEKTKTIHFNRELMQQFLANLKLRDVTITLSLLSSSQDSGDFFKLNMEDIREQIGKNRIFWEGTRDKTGVLFRTFISKEATRFIRKYIEQERKHAKDKDPLFVYARYEKQKQSNGKLKRVKVENRMNPTSLASIYRDAARKMGVKWENGEHNPLRPKRMRHLFRTACDTAGITELYTNAFMGHRNHMGQEYSELSKAKLELEYLRVEPFLTVYGQSEEALEIKEDVRKMEARMVDLNKEITQQKIAMERKVLELEGKLEVALAQNVQLKPLVYFMNLYDDYENLQRLLISIKDDIMEDYVDDRFKPLEVDFSPYLTEKIKEIAKTLGIAKEEALKKLMGDNIKSMKQAEETWKRLEERTKQPKQKK